MSNMASVAASALGSVGVAFGAVRSVQAAQQQIDAENKLAATITATGAAAGLSMEQIASYAEQRQRLTNFGDEETLNAAGMLSTFTQIQGDEFFAGITAAQDLSAAFDQDLKSSIIQVGKALNDPIRGLSALSRVGVTFNDQQREQVRLLQESGDLMGAQSVILDELNAEFGGAAEAMANPFTQFNNQVGDLSENLGFLLLPVLQETMGSLSGLLDPSTSARESFEDMGFAVADFAVMLQQGLAVALVETEIGFLKLVEVGRSAFDQLNAAWNGVSELWAHAQAELTVGIAGAMYGDDAAAEAASMTRPGVQDLMRANARSEHDAAKASRDRMRAIEVEGRQRMDALQDQFAAQKRARDAEREARRRAPDIPGLANVGSDGASLDMLAEKVGTVTEKTKELANVSSAAGITGQGKAFERVFRIAAFEPPKDDKKKAEQQAEQQNEMLMLQRRTAAAVEKLTEQIEDA